MAVDPPSTQVSAHDDGSSSNTFQSIPILSLALAKDLATKPDFLERLLDALLNVGFLYLSDTGIPEELVERVSAQTSLFFDERVLPLEEKEKIEMVNQPSFLGWSRVSLVFPFS
jgi:isopenicillin N synthase-like dioxygenase